MVFYPTQIEYSDKYYDKIYEYRHVSLPKEYLKKLTGKLMSEEEWRALGIQQSKGWEHYTIYSKEKHVIMFRRPIGINPETGEVPEEVQQIVKNWELMRSQVI